SSGKFGTFKGEVTQINGKTLTLYDPAARSNAIVLVDSKTQIFNSGGVAVGVVVNGAGVQTGTHQVKLTSGQASTIASITARCIQGY
ncbi:MAG: hypothetical protein H7293_04135, partial [Candidatus Saccharibacteria bacterium]|nr:hypothetical protein [Rhodoferax sp.]